MLLVTWWNASRVLECYASWDPCETYSRNHSLPMRKQILQDKKPAQDRTTETKPSSETKLNCLQTLSPDVSTWVQCSVQSLSHVWLCDPMDCSTPDLPCPSPTLGAYSNSCPLSRWCHPTISSSFVPFSSCLQSFPASGSFQMSQFFASDGIKVLEFQLQHQSFQWTFRTDFV